jgi:hypothetical protein
MTREAALRGGFLAFAGKVENRRMVSGNGHALKLCWNEGASAQVMTQLSGSEAWRVPSAPLFVALRPQHRNTIRVSIFPARE